MSVSSILIKWYKVNRRNLPWRQTNDPYAIWLSEILLQQTRVEQGTPYYYRFIEQFPTVKALADAPNELIMKLWQGLGYYSRARNLHKAAIYIRDHYKSKFPTDYHTIRNLPGVGDYTAAAVASFAYDLPHAVVDGNVYRVLSRLYGVFTPIDTPAGKKEFAALAEEVLNSSNPGIHNQAIMEFGAMQCKPANPQCDTCVLRLQCSAYQLGHIALLPAKARKTKVTIRHFNYLLIRHKDSIYLNKRTEKGIWQNLFEFPVIETSKACITEELMETDLWSQYFRDNKISINSVSDMKPHKLSHQTIYTRLLDISIGSETDKRLNGKFKKVKTQDVVNYAVPRIVEKILEEKIESYSG